MTTNILTTETVLAAKTRIVLTPPQLQCFANVPLFLLPRRAQLGGLVLVRIHKEGTTLPFNFMI